MSWWSALPMRSVRCRNGISGSGASVMCEAAGWEHAGPAAACEPVARDPVPVRRWIAWRLPEVTEHHRRTHLRGRLRGGQTNARWRLRPSFPCADPTSRLHIPDSSQPVWSPSAETVSGGTPWMVGRPLPASDGCVTGAAPAERGDPASVLARHRTSPPITRG